MKEDILGFLERNGPSVPATIASSLRKDSVLVNAVLSELIRDKKVYLTDMRYGRSRLHYLAGQEAQLDSFIDKLNEKDRATARKLKEARVLRDSEVEPLTRVSLRNIPDFAVPLEVSFNQRREVFWKWHLLSSDEAVNRIKEMLGVKDEEVASSRHAPEEMHTTEPEKDSSETEASAAERDEYPGEAESSAKAEEKVKPQSHQEQEEPAASADGESAEEHRPEEETYTHDSQGLLETETDDPFGNEVISFLKEKDIRVIRCDVERKGTDLDLEVIVPSPVGGLRYYCKARKKKSIDDGDLAAAYVTALMRKLPALFVTPGTLTKKAQEKCDQEMLSMSVVEMV